MSDSVAWKTSFLDRYLTVWIFAAWALACSSAASSPQPPMAAHRPRIPDYRS